MSECTHKFEARYTEKPTSLDRGNIEFTAQNIDPEQLRKMFVRQEYIYDICIHCGFTIAPKETKNANGK